MRFKDFLIGWCGLFGKVLRADVLGTVLKTNSQHSPCLLNHTLTGACACVCIVASLSWGLCVHICLSRALLPTPVHIHQPGRTHICTGYFRSRAPDGGEQINQLHLCSSNQTRLLSGSGSPTWKGPSQSKVAVMWGLAFVHVTVTRSGSSCCQGIEGWRGGKMDKRGWIQRRKQRNNSSSLAVCLQLETALLVLIFICRSAVWSSVSLSLIGSINPWKRCE